MKIFASLLFAATLHAADPTPWDSMTGVRGDATIKLNTGQSIRRTGTFRFTPSAVEYLPNGSVPRWTVKEVVIRAPREPYEGWLLFGPGALVCALVEPDYSYLLPVAVPVAAVTAIPWLAWEGLRKLKPTKILYRVAP